MANEIDLGAVKQAQQVVWSTGDFARIGALAQYVSEVMVESAGVTPGDKVLDVACGSGNAAIAAARRWAESTGVDFVPALLEAAKVRSAAEGFEIEWVEGDAEDIPCADGAFDVVLSTWGSMFAPDHRKAASELLRVCRSGGTIAMNNWTPEGLVGQMFKIVAGGPPPPGIQPPSLWGTEDHVYEMFGDGVSEVRFKRRMYNQRFRSFDHFFEFFRAWFGPMKMAWDNSDEANRERLEREMRELMEGANISGGEALVAPAEYLEVVATRA